MANHKQCKNVCQLTMFRTKVHSEILSVKIRIISGPYLDKKCIQLSDPASSYETLTIYFVVKPFKKRFEQGVMKF